VAALKRKLEHKCKNAFSKKSTTSVNFKYPISMSLWEGEFEKKTELRKKRLRFLPISGIYVRNKRKRKQAILGKETNLRKLRKKYILTLSFQEEFCKFVKR